MPKRITVKYEKCTGCRICEIVCSLSRFNRVSHRDSRISVYSFAPGLDIPILCVQCTKAACLESCQANAIEKNERGLVDVMTDRCTGCGACSIACPAGAIKIHPETHVAFKCDLCNGNPQCVDYCPTHALDFRDVPFDTRVYAKKAREIAKLLNKSLLGLEE